MFGVSSQASCWCKPPAISTYSLYFTTLARTIACHHAPGIYHHANPVPLYFRALRLVDFTCSAYQNDIQQRQISGAGVGTDEPLYLVEGELEPPGRLYV